MIRTVAVFQDICGLGRCSMTTAVSVLSALKARPCPVPTAVFSAHTGYESYTMRDLTDDLSGFIASFGENGKCFDAVYSGYLSSPRQLDAVKGSLSLLKPDGFLFLDPVMGDNGRGYAVTGRPGYLDTMRELASLARIITPNVTEACMLTGEEYPGELCSEQNARRLMEKVLCLGCKNVVLTGVVSGDLIGAGFMGEAGEGFFFAPRARGGYPGTGDLFASVLLGRILGGFSLADGVSEACGFVSQCARLASESKDLDPKDGVPYEQLLHLLI